MDAAQLLRTARRRSGLSQRDFADLAGVSARSVASWESGKHTPGAAALDRFLAATGLDLALIERVPPVDDAAIRRHLHSSLTERLRLALGESPVLACPPRGTAWRELAALSRQGQVVLDPPLAVAMWLPLGHLTAVSVSVFHPRAAITAGLVDVQLPSGEPHPALIPLMIGVGERVWVLPPAELARPTELAARLQQVDQLLHDDAPLDDAARRRPAHRDPDEADEDWRLLRTKGVANRPDMRDGRGWRLAAPASLAQRLRDG